MSKVSGKNIVLGVSGGISAYKSCELVRRLLEEQATVFVMMTRNATNFISPLTFQTLSKNRVSVDLFDPERESEIGHISLADCADLIVIAPATATLLGKAASGIADNIINAVILASRAPVIFCPSMNVNMFTNKVVQENIQKLKDYGFIIVEPEEGNLACGWEGVGRLPEVNTILEEIHRTFTKKDLIGERVLVSAGATREFIDSIRYISNPSSGKMGFAIARSAWMRGAEVVLVSGQTNENPPRGVKKINITTADEMYNAVWSNLDWATVVIKAAAVGDYTPVNTFEGKLKKGTSEFVLKLRRTKDILSSIGKNKNGKILVGFAAESENIVENALGKLRKKNADLVVANDILKPNAGFGEDTNQVFFIDRFGKVQELPLMKKTEIAEKILDKVKEIKNEISLAVNV